MVYRLSIEGHAIVPALPLSSITELTPHLPQLWWVRAQGQLKRLVRAIGRGVVVK
jgi:hypothetical protein